MNLPPQVLKEVTNTPYIIHYQRGSLSKCLEWTKTSVSCGVDNRTYWPQIKNKESCFVKLRINCRSLPWIVILRIVEVKRLELLSLLLLWYHGEGFVSDFKTRNLHHNGRILTSSDRNRTTSSDTYSASFQTKVTPISSHSSTLPFLEKKERQILNRKVCV